MRLFLDGEKKYRLKQKGLIYNLDLIRITIWTEKKNSYVYIFFSPRFANWQIYEKNILNMKLDWKKSITSKEARNIKSSEIKVAI